MDSNVVEETPSSKQHHDQIQQYQISSFYFSNVDWPMQVVEEYFLPYDLLLLLYRGSADRRVEWIIQKSLTLDGYSAALHTGR